MICRVHAAQTVSSVSPKPHYGAFRSKDPGQDLSGSFQGAGGIGGLLTAQLYNPTTSNSVTVLYCYDANGNIGQLVDDTGSNILAHYEYSPFGKAIVATGPLAEVNAIGFSTKYWDEETRLGYWGYRWLQDGRWTSMDPVWPVSGMNAYSYLANRPMDLVDMLGLCKCGQWRTFFTIETCESCLLSWDPGFWTDTLLYSWNDVVALASLPVAGLNIPQSVVAAITAIQGVTFVTLKFDEMGRVRTETAVAVNYDVGTCQDQYCIAWGPLSWYENSGPPYACKRETSRTPWSNSVWDLYTRLTVTVVDDVYEWGKDDSEAKNPSPCLSANGFNLPEPHY